MTGKPFRKLALSFLAFLLIMVASSVPACQEMGMPPEADFTAAPTSGAAPLKVQFTDTSTGQVTGWEWDFNANGEIDSVEQHPVFVFQNPGVYTVALTAKGPVVKDTVVIEQLIKVAIPEEGRDWPAYDFGYHVRPAGGFAGSIRSFTMRGTSLEDGVARKFSLEGTYSGISTVPIVTILTETDLTSQETTEKELVKPLECHEVRHRIVMDHGGGGIVYPEWVDITLWIPTGELTKDPEYHWVYVKAVLEDSEGNSAEWSYYTDVIMRDEAKYPPPGKEITYNPHVRGSFDHYDRWAIHGLYGWAWTLGRGFADQGMVLDDGTMEWNGLTYHLARDNRSVGAYEFHAWSITADAMIDNKEVEYRANMTPEFPLPLTFRLQFKGVQDFVDYRLTGVVISRSLGMSS